MRILARNEWDRDFVPQHPYTRHQPERIVIHHSYKPNKSGYVGVNTVRAIRDYHVDHNGWNDIAYHYIISPDGRDVYEGRPDNVVGAHCGGRLPSGVRRKFGNTGSIGILLIGNYDVEQTEQNGLVTLMELIEMLADKYGISLKNVYGHCDAWSVPPKSCPGKNLYTELFGKIRWERIKNEL